MSDRLRGPVRAAVGVLLVVVSLLSAWVAAEPVSRVAPATPVVIGHRLLLHSEILGEDRELLIAPPGGPVAPAHPLPVVVVLDGRFNFEHTAATVDLLTRQGLMPPSLVVALANTVRERDFTAVHNLAPESGGADRFLDFVELELIPFLVATYDTAPHRTIVGHSLGALLLMHAIVDRPHLFQAAVAISPALTNDERVGEGRTPLSARLAAAFASRGRQAMTLFMTVSDGEDRRWLEDLATTVRVLEAFVPEGFSWRLERMAGEDHTSTVHRSTYDGLRWIHRDWNVDALAESGDLGALESRFEAISARLGFEVLPPEAALNRIGYRLLEAGRGREAVAVFERAADLYPGSANAQDSLGEGLEQSGKLPGAVRCYRRAVAAAEASGDPNLAIYRAHLARLEQRLFGGGSDERTGSAAPAGGRGSIQPDGGS